MDCLRRLRHSRHPRQQPPAPGFRRRRKGCAHCAHPWRPADGRGGYLPITATTRDGRHAQIGRAESFGQITDAECEANGGLLVDSRNAMPRLLAELFLYRSTGIPAAEAPEIVDEFRRLRMDNQHADRLIGQQRAAIGRLTAENARLAQENAALRGVAKAGDAMPQDGLALIAAERHANVTRRGYDAAHDDTHAKGELAYEALRWLAERTPVYHVADGMCGTSAHRKSKPRVRQLVIAGALIVAEIDRLQRAAAAQLIERGEQPRPQVDGAAPVAPDVAAEAVEILRDIQWSAETDGDDDSADDYVDCCPVCGGTEADGHVDHCRLAAVLRAAPVVAPAPA